MASSTVMLRPPVGYKGGKRRLLPHLAPYLSTVDDVYVEPFIGMGAAYLHLRQHGFIGRALAAESNLAVQIFWECVHQRGEELLTFARSLPEPSVDGFWVRAGSPVGGSIELAGTFLWLCNIAYSNDPPTYSTDEDHWITVGTKMTSAEKWNKKFPWSACVKRLEGLVTVLYGKPFEVYSNAEKLLRTDWNDSVLLYADPPYNQSSRYLREGTNPDDFSTLILGTTSRTIYSEKSELSLPDGWHAEEVSLTARTSSGTGAIGQRREFIYSNFLV